MTLMVELDLDNVMLNRYAKHLGRPGRQAHNRANSLTGQPNKKYENTWIAVVSATLDRVCWNFV